MSMANSPFALENKDAYAKWRDTKMANYPEQVGELVVEIRDVTAPTKAESDKIRALCRQTNMAVYASPPKKGPENAVALGAQFGLNRLDVPLLTGENGVTALTVSSDGRRTAYIPYTTRPIAWHTDGYYNLPTEQIRGLLLYCEQPAMEGGVSELMDHEVAYIMLREEDPAYIEALMRNDAMTIPPNEEGGTEIRGASTGPIFSVIAGNLHMRYTIRKRYIEWSTAPEVERARQRLLEILGAPSPYKYEHKLDAGQGLISNNVLHTRSGFEDSDEKDKKRLLYRARYLDRVNS